MPIRVAKNKDGTFQYMQDYEGEWKPFGPAMPEPPSKEEFARYKEMGPQFAQRKEEGDGIKLSAEATSKVHGRDPQGIFDTIKRNLENTWFGVKQISGNTTPEEDAAWAKEEQIRSNLTPWPTAGAALGTELAGGTVGPKILQKGVVGLAEHQAKQRAKDEMIRDTPVSESIKSLADKLQYGHGSVMPAGIGGGIAGAGVGLTAPLTPEQMNEEWKNRFIASGANAVAGKTIDMLGTGMGNLMDYGKALDFDKALAGDLPESLRFPRHLALQDPKAAIQWEQAGRGQLGPKAQADVISSERRTNLKLKNNVNDMRQSFANNPQSRERMGLRPASGPVAPASNEIAAGWDKPLGDMRKEAARLKKQGSKLYDQARVLGPIYGDTVDLDTALMQAKNKLYLGPQSKYSRTDLAAPVKGVIRELDSLANRDSDMFNVDDLMGLHRKLNASYRKPGSTDADLINTQITDLKREIDGMIDKTNISGDDLAIQKWRDARKLYTEWNSKYMDDPITRLAMDPNTNPERLADKLFPRSWKHSTSLDDRVNAVNNLLSVHPNWKPYLKQDLFNAMASDSKNGVFDSKRFMQNYNDHVATGRFMPVMKSLYDDDELSRMGDLYNVTSIRNTNFADPDFTPGYAPGPIAEFTEPMISPDILNPLRWGQGKNTAAIRRARSGAMPSGRAYALPGGIGSGEMAAAMGLDEWGTEEGERGQAREFFSDLVKDQNLSLERARERDQAEKWKRANIYNR